MEYYCDENNDLALEVYIENPTPRNAIYQKYQPALIDIAVKIFKTCANKNYASNKHILSHVYDPNNIYSYSKNLHGLYTDKNIMFKLIQYVFKRYKWDIIEFIIKSLSDVKYSRKYSINDKLSSNVGFYIYNGNVKWSNTYKVSFNLTKDNKLVLKTTFITPYLEYNDAQLKKDPELIDRLVEKTGGYDGYVKNGHIIWK